MAKKPPARVEEVNRGQTFLEPRSFDAMIPADHPARAIWALVERLDLSAFYEPIRSREGGIGRSATDPKMLLALWLFAIADGEGSAREIVRLTESHDAYRWLRGNAGLNAHTLSDFRTKHDDALDGLLTQLIASLLQAKLVTLFRVAQDGTKVRANAGAASFRQKSTLHRLLKDAKQQLRAVDAAARDGAMTEKKAAAQRRAADERVERVEEALAALDKVRTPKMEKLRDAKGKKKSPPRASTTDADARIMKGGDGGYRPSFNVQLATEEESGLIIGARVTTSAADNHQMVPMLDDIESRLGQKPQQFLVDGGYLHFESVDAVAEKDVELFLSLEGLADVNRAGEAVDKYEPKETDSPAVAALRTRMKSKSGKRIYAKRSAIAELPNARLKERMAMRQFLVRGLKKVSAMTMLMVLAHNASRVISLGW